VADTPYEANCTFRKSNKVELERLVAIDPKATIFMHGTTYVAGARLADVNREIALIERAELCNG
jgi:hypothetical protein